MSLPLRIDDDHLTKLESQLRNKTPDPIDKIKARRHRQLLFLESYQKTATITVSEDHAGVGRGSFTRWKNTDPEFCKMFNETLSVMHDSLKSHLIVRARGYRKFNPDGSPANDADGTPLYVDGNDNILMKLTGLDGQVVKHEHTLTIEVVSRDKQEKVIEHKPEV